MIKKRRVVITGMSTINPLGDNLNDYYNNLIAGKSGIKKWSSMDMSKVECKIGGDLGDYDLNSALLKFKDKLEESEFKKLRKLFKMTTFSNKFTILCALDAYISAGLYKNNYDPFKTSAIVGGHNLNSRYIDKNNKQFEDEPEWIDALFGVEALDPNAAALVSEILSIKGPTFTVGGACASGNLALRDGYRDIITGECDRSVVVGALFDMTPADIHAMVFLNSVVIKKEYQENPEKASRPFDTNRCGFVPSHGAGALVIEELESAKKRGAKIYAELIDIRANSNANHLPAPSSESQSHLIKQLLDDNNIKPEQIDYINCHATGTPLGDIEEIDAIKNVFGTKNSNLKINAPKSMLGHVTWSAPIVETIGAILQMNNNMLHPTINIDEQDPKVPYDVCANKPQKHTINYLIKNSFGFGGINSCSLIKKYEE